MVSDGAAASVALAAIAWDQARRDASRLRRERASLRCEHEAEAEYNEHGYQSADAVVACWKQHWQDQYGRDCTLPRTDWCDTCRKRQVVHDAYTKAVAKRQGLRRGLQRRAFTAAQAEAAPV